MTDDAARAADETRLMMVTGHWIQQMVSVIARIGLPNHIGDEPREVDELAKILDVNADTLFRISRALSRVGILKVEGTKIGLTDAGRFLRDDEPGSLRHVAAFSGCPGPWKAWGELITTLTSPGPTMQRAHGKDLWGYFADNPDDAHHFNRSMANITGAALSRVMDAYDFSEAKVICDIGGGAGSVVDTMLRAHPEQHGIVVDLEKVIEDAKGIWKDRTHADRCSLVVGDFFKSIPEGADIYLLKNIIHDWDDDKAVQILRCCARAMSPSSKIVLLESPLEEDGPPFPFLLDIHMLVLLGGRERTLEEYQALMSQAGLELTRTVPTGGLLSVLEGKKTS